MLLIDEATIKPTQSLLSHVERKRVNVADELRLEFLFELSRLILKSNKAKSYPDLCTFAYYCREKSILSKLETYSSIRNKKGWGTIIHIAPANVPINFAFSFIFGFLSGNSNVVRLPSKSWPQVEMLIDFIGQVLEKDAYKTIKDTLVFIKTEHDSGWLKEGIKNCDGLLVWGGDDTVSQFRSFPKLPRCVEMYFPNRVSSLVIDAKSFALNDAKQRQRVLQSFYNDTYVVDHNACSSPSKVLWVGSDAEVKEAQALFWKEAKEVLNIKQYSLDPVARIDRYLDLMESISIQNGPAVLSQWAPDLWTQNDSSNNGLYRYGNFLQLSHPNLLAALSNLEQDEQTLTYFGFDPQLIAKNLEENGSLVDRIVPIGRALEMNFLWDGVNLLDRFSRYTETD
ncbi:acyl-CoA reductase [Neptuniibacter sp. SY11_33]|uniref:acyl-CoA reductase n=1 Tax=Neptuniibacter sp. SY11_33 TaxID=3398215 RepID=UPI0039F4851E